MYPTPKVCKRSHFHPSGIVKQRSDDMLSSLPKDILFHILSFLDTADVVRTSFLSKNWRYIWTYVPRLNFDFSRFSDKRGYIYVNLNESFSKFFYFIKRALVVREAPPVHKVTLVCDFMNVIEFHLMIRLCSMRDAQELEIVTDSYLHYPFSHSFFESISSWAQIYNSPFKLQSSTAFANLKSLRLVNTEFRCAYVTENLLSDCGILEVLSLEGCWLPVMNTLSISGQKLRKLTLANMGCWSVKLPAHFKGGLKVHAPNLVSFCYVGPVLLPWQFSNMSSLNSASIEIYRESYSTVDYVALWPMFYCVAHAKEWSLSATFVLFFSEDQFGLNWNFTPFHYLRSLKLELICSADCMEGLIHLLKLSPNLDVLSVNFSKCSRTIAWKFHEDDVVILSHHLKEISVTKFHCPIFLLDFIKLFLRNAKSLEKIQIVQKRKKLDPNELYALQAYNVASDEVSMSLISISDCGEKELLKFIYRKRRVALWKRIPKLKIKSKLRYRVMNSAGSSRWVRKKYTRG